MQLATASTHRASEEEEEEDDDDFDVDDDDEDDDTVLQTARDAGHECMR